MGAEEHQPAPSTGGGLRRGLVTLVLVLAILWVTAFFAARTVTCTQYLAGQVSARLGVKVTAGASRMVPPFGLRLDAIVSEDYAPGAAGLRADALQVALGYRPWLRITVVRPEVNLVYTGGGWLPAKLAPLGELPDASVASLSDLCDRWRQTAVLRIDDGALNWVDAGGARTAFAENVVLRVSPLRLDGRPASFYRLRAGRAQEPGMEPVEGVLLEWLSVGANRFIEVTRSSALPPAAADGFWGIRHDYTR